MANNNGEMMSSVASPVTQKNSYTPRETLAVKPVPIYEETEEGVEDRPNTVTELIEIA